MNHIIVFKLVKYDAAKQKGDANNKYDHNNDSSKNETTVAVAVVPVDETMTPESISTSHERYMARLRDMVQDGSISTQQQPNGALPKTMDVIVPAKEIQDTLLSVGNNCASMDIDEGMASNVLTSATIMPSSLSRGSRKVTTATEFFGGRKNNNNSETNASAATATKYSTPTEVCSASKDIPPKNVVTNKLGFSSKSKIETANKKRIKESSSCPAVGDENNGKENNTDHLLRQPHKALKKLNDIPPKKTMTTKNHHIVGNADDFMGDVDDEDDDDDDSHEDDIVTNAKDADSKSRAEVHVMDVDDDDDHLDEDAMETEKIATTIDGNNSDDEEERYNKKGAMDAFVVPAVASVHNDTAGTSRRRRKKLVEKTFVDAKGYLHTETQEVWEEVLSDDDDNEKKNTNNDGNHRSSSSAKDGTKKQQQQVIGGNAKAASSKRLPPSTKGGKKTAGGKNDKLKQGNLMGFFAKK